MTAKVINFILNVTLIWD